MKLKDARISILIGSESTTIELIDNTSSITFASVTLTPEQLSNALSRVTYTPCQIDVKGLDKLNKKMVNKYHEFEIPKDIPYSDKNKILSDIIKDTLPDGWISDNYFSSQNTFFKKDGKDYARTTIRQWVDIEEEIDPVS